MSHPVHRHFEKIYLIAIPQRRERSLGVMSEMGIAPTVVEAIWRDDLPPLPALLADRVVTPRFFLNLFPRELVGVESIVGTIDETFLADRPDQLNSIRGKIALHLTRLRLCKEFLKTDEQSMIIFEDDLAPPTDLDAHQRRFATIFEEELPPDWDVVNLGRCFDCCAANTPFSEHLVTDTYPFCAHALALSRRAAERILARTTPMYHSGDAMFRDVLYQDPAIRAFSAIEALFHQDRGAVGSTLGNNQQLLPECVGGVPPSMQLAEELGIPAL